MFKKSIVNRARFIVLVVAIAVIATTYVFEMKDIKKEPLFTSSVRPKCAPSLTPTSETLKKLTPDFREQIAREAPESIIEVFIGLQDDEKLSPMPKLQYPLPVMRNHQLIISPTNQAIMKKQDAMYKEQLQRWKKSQDALIRKLASLGLVETKQDWEINGFFAKLPVCNVLTVAQQPEVANIIEAPGGERIYLN